MKIVSSWRDWCDISDQNWSDEWRSFMNSNSKKYASEIVVQSKLGYINYGYRFETGVLTEQVV